MIRVTPSSFLFHLFTFDVNYRSIMKEQYEMSKKGIDWETSNNFTEFQREAIVDLIMTDYKREAELIKATGPRIGGMF